jgi:hypothetical protein
VNGTNFVSTSVVRWNGSDRATTFVSATQLTATVPASDIAVAGTAQVTVFNPAPGGGVSGPQTFTITNPVPTVPTITALSPASAIAGGEGFILTVNGINFVSGSVVRWNGSDRTTTFVSATQLTATILASDIAVAGTAQVTVFNPPPGGGTSNSLTFTVFSSPTLLFDDFGDGVADGWTISPLGNAAGWSVVNGVYRYDGRGPTQSYRGDPTWTDYSLEAKFLLKTPSNYPGGIRGRVDVSTGTGYAVWLYPESRVVRLYRETGWNINTWGLTQLGFASEIALDTLNFHTIRLSFSGPSIQVYYDGTLIISASDTAYSSGVIALDVYDQAVDFDDIIVTVGGGTGSPVPVTTSISPSSAVAGGGSFTLTVNGTNFVSTSVVRWNGSDRATTFVSATQLTATVPASDIAVAGTAQVTVFNPAPGGGTSNSQTFTIYNP